METNNKANNTTITEIKINKNIIGEENKTAAIQINCKLNKEKQVISATNDNEILGWLKNCKAYYLKRVEDKTKEIRKMWNLSKADAEEFSYAIGWLLLAEDDLADKDTTSALENFIYAKVYFRSIKHTKANMIAQIDVLGALKSFEQRFFKQYN